MKTETFSYNDHIHFKNWLELNLNSISWEGRFLDDFNEVWDLIFESGGSISDQFRTFAEVKKQLTQGPVISWFNWLRDQFISYLFLYKDLSIADLIEISKMDKSSISIVLRSFLVDKFPHLDDAISEYIQMGSCLTVNKDVTYKFLQEKLSLDSEVRGDIDDSVMSSLEVTLYTDWKKVGSYLKLKKESPQFAKKVIRDRNFFKRQSRFIFDTMILFFIGTILIFAVKYGNRYYEDHLVEKISVFEPSFFWLDKNLSFEPLVGKVSEDDIDLKVDEIEKLEKIGAQKVFQDNLNPTRFEVESDVVLTSVDTLPKDFSVADLEQSEYEEVRKGGYRNSRYGRRKAYRVMLTSVDPKALKAEIIKVMEKYKVKQVDNVKPGTNIPGGIYFNLYVPRPDLKSFLSKVSGFEKQSTILESRTVFGGPINTNKVFIWIKSI